MRPQLGGMVRGAYVFR